MADFDRVTMHKRLREIKELADAAYWQLLDLRILLGKTEAGLTASVDATVLPSEELGNDEHHAVTAEESRQDGSSERDQ